MSNFQVILKTQQQNATMPLRRHRAHAPTNTMYPVHITCHLQMHNACTCHFIPRQRRRLRLSLKVKLRTQICIEHAYIYYYGLIDR